MSGLPRCTYCGARVNPDYPTTYTRITGWEQPRKAGGANMIHLRERLPEFACSTCIDRLKRGISTEQQTLIA